MSKTITSTVVLILALLIFTSNSFATFEEYKIVGSSGSFVEKTVFDLDDPSPHIYMKLPDAGQAFTGTFFWTAPDSTTYYQTTSGTDLDRWLALDNWDSIKAPGVWETKTNYFYNNGTSGFATANFTVTPEPLAMTLFFIGGVPIAASLYRKRKKSVRV